MGVFHRSLGGGGSCGGKASLAVDLPALLSVALSVAEAVAYLHSIRLCHCDVKVRGILGCAQHEVQIEAIQLIPQSARVPLGSMMPAPLLHANGR
jgi:hypothetical protein